MAQRSAVTFPPCATSSDDTRRYAQASKRKAARRSRHQSDCQRACICSFDIPLFSNFYRNRTNRPLSADTTESNVAGRAPKLAADGRPHNPPFGFVCLCGWTAALRTLNIRHPSRDLRISRKISTSQPPFLRATEPNRRCPPLHHLHRHRRRAWEDRRRRRLLRPGAYPEDRQAQDEYVMMAQPKSDGERPKS